MKTYQKAPLKSSYNVNIRYNIGKSKKNIIGKAQSKKLGFFILIFLLFTQAQATEPLILTASWYSIASLKRDGQWKITKGVMANGEKFRDEGFTCASRDFKLGTKLLITAGNGKSVIVRVTDRINKRYKGKRIDLSKSAFNLLAPLSQGLILVTVEKAR
jgi:rare lipoprotein A